MCYGKLHVLHVGLGDIHVWVLGYYRDKYIHDNIIASKLAYHDNHANDNTTITVNTTSTLLPLSTVNSSRYKLETSCLQCSTTGILFTKLWFVEKQANIPGYSSLHHLCLTGRQQKCS